MQRYSNPIYERGVVLVSVLSVVAFLVIMTTGLAVMLDREVRITGFTQAQRQADWLAEGVEAWAIQTLYKDGLETEDDNLTEVWAKPLPVTQIEHGELTAQIFDQQTKININALVLNGIPNELQIARFKRLLTHLELEPSFLDPIIDWIDTDEKARFPYGAEDGHYLNQSQPYRAANRPISSISELKWIRGMTPEVYAKLSPYVVALPQDKYEININTADAVVYALLADGITRQEGEQLVSLRDKNGPYEIEEFILHPIFAGRNLDTKGLSTKSYHFMLRAEVKYQDITVLRKTHFSRDKTNNKVHIVRRSSS